MNQQKILELIQASQATLKHELMPKHSESRYNLLMLQRSFEIVKNYIESSEYAQTKQLDLFQQHFQFPVQDVEQSMEQLSQDMRTAFQPDAFAILQQLNELEMSLIKTGKST